MNVPSDPDATPALHRPHADWPLPIVFARMALRCDGAHLTHLHGNRSAATCCILPQRAILHGKCLLIIRRHAGIQARPKHFRLFACVAKNLIGFCFLRAPFYRHS
jgi:hypothetical protein